MKITLNELRSLVKQVLRETEEEKGKKGNNKKYPDAEPEEGIKLNLKSSMEDYLEKYSTSQILDVMANYYKGETAKALKSLSSKLRKGLYEGYEESEVDRYSSYNQNIDERLKAYAEENGEDFSEMKSYFMNQADPYNMKTPKEAKDAYFKIVNKFLKDEKRKEEESEEEGY